MLFEQPGTCPPDWLLDEARTQIDQAIALDTIHARKYEDQILSVGASGGEGGIAGRTKDEGGARC